MRTITLTLAALLLLAPSAGAQDDPVTRAQRHLDAGLADFQKGAYAAALLEFEAGYALDARPAFLYAMAQAHRMQGDCATAIALYERFLVSQPPPSAAQVAATRANIERCGGAPQLEAEDPAATIVIEEAPATAPATPRAERKRWSPVDLTLVGAGALSLGLGVAFVVASYSDEEDASMAFTYRDHAALLDRAGSRRVGGWIAIAAGTALMTTGIIRHVSVTPHAGGAAVSVGGRW